MAQKFHAILTVDESGIRLECMGLTPEYDTEFLYRQMLKCDMYMEYQTSPVRLFPRPIIHFPFIQPYRRSND